MSSVKTVFIIVMENHNWSQIKGSASAPYINNTLLPMSSYATQYYNPPGNHPSLPNYLWLEAGTNFGVTNDSDPSVHHQSTTSHLATQLQNAGISWKAYEEDISGTGCPLTSVGNYAPKHNPFVYFDDVTNTNSTTSANCITHVRPYTELATDIAHNTLPRYVFITPNLCHDMHNSCAPTYNTIRQGDNWLSTEVPKILNSAAYKNGGALFVTWDEAANGDGPIGMIVVSSLAKGGGYHNAIHYTSGSTLRTFEEIFGLPPIRDAAVQTDLGDLFKAPSTPPAPTSLAATAANSQVALSWNMASSAESYNIKRSTIAGGSYTNVASVLTTSFTDTGVTDGTAYYYVVSAVNSAGQSANSTAVAATPTLGPPAAPANLSATGGNAQVHLSWSRSPRAVAYDLKRSTVHGGPYTTIASGLTTTAATDTQVVNGTVYYYVVSGVNGTGEGANSAETGAKPVSTETLVYQVTAGGSGATSYRADTYFNGGLAASTTTAINTSGVINPAPQAVYQSWRGGSNEAYSFSYAFHGLTANATYVVRLHFSENAQSRAGARLFNVSINGRQVLSNFDIFAAAGGQYKAVAEAFTATASSNGQMVIFFSAVTANQGPVVNGIEISH